jgi:hypothetical protein
MSFLQNVSKVCRDFFSEMKSMKRVFVWVFLAQGFVLALALILGYQRDNLDKHFGEAGFVTTFSFFNLLFISYVLAIVFYTALSSSEKNGDSLKKRFAKSVIWLVMAIGFLWLSFDEILMIHEKTDKAFHQFFQIKETSLTNRMDDIMVFSYPVLGLLAMYFSRKALYPYRKSLYFVVLGVALFCIMAVYDSMGKGLSSKYHNTRTMYQVYEESSKVLAEGFLMVASLYCLRVSNSVRRKREME